MYVYKGSLVCIGPADENHRLHIACTLHNMANILAMTGKYKSMLVYRAWERRFLLLKVVWWEKGSG